MSDRNDREERGGDRRSSEGVRIIRPEEAQAAIDAGQAAGRRADDELRFGDVPPAPSGPRPPHRFPLPDSVDPAAAVPRPPIVPPSRGEHATPVGRGRAVSPDQAHDPRPWQDRKGPAPSLPVPDDDLQHADPPAVAGNPEGPHEPVPAPGVAAEPESAPQQDPAGGDAPAWAQAPGAGHPDDHPSVADTAPVWMAPAAESAARDAGDADPTSVLSAPDVVGEAPAPRTGAGATGAPAWAPSGDLPSWTGRSTSPSWAAAAGRRPWHAEVAPAEPPPAEPLPADAAATASAGGEPAAGEPAPGQPAAGEALAGRGGPRSDPDESDASPPGWPPGGGWRPADAVPEPPPAPAYEGPWSERPASFAAPGRPAPAWSPPEYPAGTSSYEPPAPADDPGAARPDLSLPDEGMTVTGGFGTELPHWTDPPTGEVPRILPQSDNDDLAAWEALGAQGTRWRDDATGGWDAPAFDDLADDETRVGALDQSRSEHSDLYSFDEEFDRLEEERSGSHRAVAAADVDVDDFEDFSDLEVEPVPVGAPGPRSGRPRPARSARPPRPPRPGGGGGVRGGSAGGADLGSRLAVGVGLVILLGISYAVGPVALLVLSTAVVVVAAVEVYGMLQRSGFKPATLLGLVATTGLMFGAYWRGAGALPLIVALVFIASMLWYLLGIVEARPLANVAVTMTAFVWVGVLGSYAALLLRAHHGKGLFLGAVLPAVAADIVAYFVGRQMGSRLLAPRVSPAKTLEGAIGGGLAAVVVALLVGHSLTPWGGTKHGLILGLVVAVLAPIGDLFESMIKRDLDVKDSGSLLSGHGGVLDRFDAVLLVLPAAYYLASYFGVLR